MNSRLNHKKVIINVLLFIISATVIIYARSTGITGRTLKNGTGCDCHSPSPSSNVNVTISGPDQLAVNETAVYTVTISGGPLTRAGTNIAASSGILAPASSDLRFENNELTHVQPKAPSGGSVTFQFNYTAPAQEGNITLYANGNSVNFNGNNTGDQWNFAPNKSVVVTSLTNVDDEYALNNYQLKQNFPNPFNPTTTINFSLKDAAKVSLKIYNSIGDEVAVLADENYSAGEHSVSFNAEGLTSGVYYYKLISDKFSETKKMLLLK